VSGPDWHLESAYDFLWSAEQPALAWAYLRLNPAFLEDCARLEQNLRHGRLKGEDEDVFALRWGVRFRGGAADEFRRRGLLGRARTAQRPPPDEFSS
jgi:hypothetical protein